MFYGYDRTGFPLIPIFETGIEVHLLPVTKIQFEDFLKATGRSDDAGHKEMLELNPKVSHLKFTSDNREQLFITGVLPDEVTEFARWMGSDYDIMTVAEWRRVHEELSVVEDPLYASTDLPIQSPQNPVGELMERFKERCQPKTLFDLTLMKNGVVEWVRQDGTWVGLGCPRHEFYQHLWDPLADVIRPVDLKFRLKYFGFRLVRRIA
jgi:hypothetical protein